MDISSLLPLLLSSSLSQTNQTGTSNGSSSASFLSLMTLMMMSNSGSSDDSGMGLGTDNYQMLGMMSIMEQLLANQIRSNPTANTESTTAVRHYGSDTPSGSPVTDGEVTQEYSDSHHGIDFGVPTGSMVHSTMDGEVTFAGWSDEGYGNLVIVSRGDYQTYYAHLSDIPVQVGDPIEGGQVIGRSGNTGNSTGPHLHYEIRKKGEAIDPTSLTLG